MIHQLHLKNFKRFEDQLLSLGSLTLLSGLNGMGKSSVLQSLLLLRQSYQQGLLSETGLALNGDLVQIGTAEDALFEDAQEDKIGFSLTFEDDKKAIWEFGYDRKVDVLNLISPPAISNVYEGVVKTWVTLSPHSGRLNGCPFQSAIATSGRRHRQYESSPFRRR